MGQEWAASSPFLYFSDHEGELGRAVSEGRRREFSHFSDFHADDTIPDPQAESTFFASKLDWSEQATGEHQATLDLTRRALELRRTDPVLRAATQLSVGVAHDCLWVLRSAAQGSRLLLFNPGEARSLGEVSGYSPTRTQELLATHPKHSREGRFGLPARSALVLKTTSTGGLA
jgi:maltooligosyltrehalose trehalohydrolase